MKLSRLIVIAVLVVAGPVLVCAQTPCPEVTVKSPGDLECGKTGDGFVPYTGTAVDAKGQPLVGAHDVMLSYFAPGDSEALWTESFAQVVFLSGRFDVLLGSGAAHEQEQYHSLKAVFADSPELQMQVAVDSVTQMPRVGVLPAGHSAATRARFAGAASDGDQPHTKGYSSKSESTAVQAVNLRPAGGDPVGADTDQPNLKTNPYLIDTIFLGVSRPVRELEPATPDRKAKTKPEGREINPPRHEDLYDEDGYRYGTRTVKIDDPLAEESQRGSGRATPGLSVTFPGIGATGYAPPDTEGAVGPSHYVQVVNVAFRVYDKTGTPLTSQLATNSLWTGFGGSCESNNAGDAIFMYDEHADRWVFTQFTSYPTNIVCFAVSTSGDPTGTFNLYQVNTQRYPDYYKLGVWPDANNNAYFMGTNSGFAAQYDVYAIDRANMLAGSPANQTQYFQNHANLMMPADLDGDNLPPAGQPGIFYTFRDGGESYFDPPSAVDTLDLWEFDVDWGTPANSTMAMVQQLQNPDLTDFNWTICGFFVSDCLPQPGTGQLIDSASWWPMQRLQYRNFGSYEALVGSWTVDTESAGNHAAPRWFELQRTGGGVPWVMAHEGTLSPDSTHRWMSSVALDGSGNMAIGYSVVNAGSTIYPGLRYATRSVGSSAFDAEATMIVGGGSDTGVNRWGDYASMEVDPSDDCTFWFTSEYIASSGSFNWSTYVGAFTIPECTGTACSADPPTGLSAAGGGDNQIDLSWTAAAGATQYFIYRSQSSGGPYTQIDTVSAAQTTYSDTTVSGFITYFYVVTTFTDCESVASGEASASTTGACTDPPIFAGVQSVSTPQDPTCTLDLSWTAGTSQCGGSLTYNIYRDTTSGFDPDLVAPIATGVSGTSYSDSDSLASLTQHFYVVRAVDTSNGVEESNLVEESGVPAGPGGTTTTLLDEDFEDAGTWSDWTVTTGPGAHDCGDWIRSTFSTARPTAGSGWYALANSDGCGPTAFTSTILTSPVMDCSTVVGNAILSYDYYYRVYNGDDATVEVWDGSSWQVVWADSNVDEDDSASWDVSAYAVGNPDFQFRFSYQNAAWDWWFSVDNVLFVADIGNACTPGGCTDPGQPAILTITDDDSCAQDGVTITYSPGSGATSHDLYVDGGLAVSGFGSGSSYNPGTSNPRSYVIRAVDQSCSTDSTSQSFSDADNAPGTPGISSITDDDDCAQTGIRINYNVGSGATSHDLLRNGAAVVTGYASGALYNPGGTGSFNYTVRANNGSCTAVSGGQTFADADNTPGTPGITSIVDDDDCAQSGIRVNYNVGSGATSHDLLRNGTPVVTGYASGALYNPGGTGSFNYTVRANNGTCTAVSGGQTFADADNGPGTPGIGSITDDDDCAQTGIRVNYTVGSGATSHDLLRNGAVVVTGYASGALYNPGGTGSFTYTVRANNGSCTAVSGGQTFADADNTPGTPGIGSIVDEDDCAQTGIRINYSPGVGATSHNLVSDGIVVAPGYISGDLYDPGNDASHTYVVRAVNGGCTTNSLGQAFADQGPTEPVFSGATQLSQLSWTGGCGLLLEWADGSSSCSGGTDIAYNVYRSTTPGFVPDPATNMIASCVADTWYDDNSAVDGSTYFYVVRAEDSTTIGSGPCNGGNEDSNAVELSGTAGTGTLLGSQSVDPLVVSNASTSTFLSPDLDVVGATVATLDYGLDWSPTLVLPAADFVAGASAAVTVDLGDTATMPIGSVAAARLQYSVASGHEEVIAMDLVAEHSGATTRVELPTADEQAVSTDVTDFYTSNGPGRYQLTVTMGSGAARFVDTALTLDLLGANDLTANTRVDLIGPNGGLWTIKDFSDPNPALPVDVLAYYSDPLGGVGVWQVAIFEDAAGTATLTDAVMAVTGSTCVGGDVSGTLVDLTPVRDDISGVLVEAIETAGGTVVASTTTDAAGTFNLDDLRPDVYIIRASLDMFLWADFGHDLSAGSATVLPDVTLIGGDFDGSGDVGIVDVTYVSSRYGGGDLSADLNDNGGVDIVDVTATASAYGTVAPTPWP